MTSNKDFKRLVRARMQKTGEAYTAARAQILKKHTDASTGAAAARSATPAPARPKPKEYAALAGMSDAALKAKTGCTWERWVNALDYHRADTLAHRDIAELVSTKFKVGDWWAQTVAVGYERIKGLRARGQRRDGTYEATKSRTFDVPVATLFNAWADAKRRRRWLNGAVTRVRTSAASKSIRLDWTDNGDRAIIAVGFTAKGSGKSAVAVAHDKLPDRETANRIRQYWSERLDALRDVLAER
jgi:hypothetical protein